MSQYNCKCILAEKPLCGDDCWHFHSDKGGMCHNCNNTGVQAEDTTMSKAEAAYEVWSLTSAAIAELRNAGGQQDRVGFLAGYAAASADCEAQVRESRESVAYWNRRMGEEHSIRISVEQRCEAQVRAAVGATKEWVANILDNRDRLSDLENANYHEEREMSIQNAKRIRALDASAIVARVMRKEEQ